MLTGLDLSYQDLLTISIFLLNACGIICDFFFFSTPTCLPPPQRDVIMMYHFPQIKALSSPGVNLSVWTLYFELIGCCRNPLNMSNSIRYSITIVQFNLSNLIGFDCLFLGLSPLSIQELRSRCGGIPRQTRALAATSLSPRRSWNFSPDSAAGADSGPLGECSEIHCAWLTLEKRKGCDMKP